ncbi:MAG: hypothetical protein AAF821_09370 [Cyanobacteria bacterium P01_D01_bin.156]
MKQLKQVWSLAPKVTRLLLIAIIAIAVGSSVMAAQPNLPVTQPTKTQLLSRRTSPGIYSAPSSCSMAAPVVPALVTVAEVERRQFQADFAKFIEEQAKIDQEAGLTFNRDVLTIEKYRLDCDILAVQARQVLQADRNFPQPDVPITDLELVLRQQQFDIAEQIDEETTLAQEAGLTSLDRLWQARRDRIDSEILWLQAKEQKRLQDLQNNSN